LIANNFEAKAYALQSKTQLLPQTLLASIHPKPEYLTLLTYNVWFEEKNIENRYPCILKMLFDSDADIICLQEVTGTFINYLYDSCKALTKSQEYYIPIIQMHWYDTIILSKYPCRFYKKKFENSSMDRCNLTAVIEF
jgi:mRNA deadenylase 3'-5' endonuclease subunit Ccr4